MIADITLLAIALGAISANVLNVYSGVRPFLSTGVRLPLTLRRAVVALGFGAVALTTLGDAGHQYESFLLVIADRPVARRVLRRSARPPRPAGGRLLSDRKHTPSAGPTTMLIGMAVSVWLFSNQAEYVRVVAEAHPGVGDVTFEAGFLTSAVLYAVFCAVSHDRRAEAILIPDSV